MAAKLFNVVVIGAGVVGLAIAVALRRDGHDVTVIDRLPPGEACSFGNSGGMPRGHAFPMATPGIIWKVPGYLIDPRGPLVIRWRSLPHLAPFLLRFLRASAPARFAATLDRLTALMQESHADWTALIADAGLGDLIREDGALTLYRDAAARATAWPLWQMLIERGARVERLDQTALRALEPGAPPGYDSAVFEPDYRRTIDPYRLCLGLADHLQRTRRDAAPRDRQRGGTRRRRHIGAAHQPRRRARRPRGHRGGRLVRALRRRARRPFNRSARQLGLALGAA